MLKLLTILSLVILLSFSTARAETAYVEVEGLVCDFCARAIEKVFSKQEQVKKIDVDLDDKIITIDFKDQQKLPEDIIEKLILDSGYNVSDIRYE